ncbi:MAG: hypothetical protein NXI10_14705 [bacterium]|nr:hypothetical protein [bacterium]
MKYLTAALLLLLIIGCQNNNNPDKRLKDKNVPFEFEIGEAKDGVYSNDFFNFSFHYDTSMYIMSYEELEAAIDAESSAHDTERQRREYEASKVVTASLFGGFRFPMDSYEPSNPNVIIMAENIQGNPQVNSGDDYLKIVRSLWPQSNMDVEQIGSIQQTNIGGQTFFKLASGINSPFMDSYAGYQDYYCAVIKDFALIFIFTYFDQDESDFLKPILSSMAFKKS